VRKLLPLFAFTADTVYEKGERLKATHSHFFLWDDMANSFEISLGERTQCDI
jgi:hypothetical protein